MTDILGKINENVPFVSDFEYVVSYVGKRNSRIRFAVFIPLGLLRKCNCIPLQIGGPFNHCTFSSGGISRIGGLKFINMQNSISLCSIQKSNAFETYFVCAPFA